MFARVVPYCSSSQVLAWSTLPALLLAALLVGATPVLAAGGGGGSAEPELHEDYLAAERLIGRGKFAEALPHLRQVIADEPKNADAYNLMGYATRKMGKPKESLQFYKEALRLRPGHRGAHEYIGEAYLQLGQVDRAKEHLAYLDGDCWLPCFEYTSLKKAVAKYEAEHGR